MKIYPSYKKDICRYVPCRHAISKFQTKPLVRRILLCIVSTSKKVLLIKHNFYLYFSMFISFLATSQISKGPFTQIRLNSEDFDPQTVFCGVFFTFRDQVFWVLNLFFSDWTAIFVASSYADVIFVAQYCGVGWLFRYTYFISGSPVKSLTYLVMILLYILCFG